MKIPEQFNIKGEVWKVEQKEEIRLGEIFVDGLNDSDARTIEVREGLSDKKKDQTLLHEFLHACVHELHLTFEPQEEEIIVDGLAKCLLDNFNIEPK